MTTFVKLLHTPYKDAEMAELTEKKYRPFFYKSHKYLVGSASSALYIFIKHKRIFNQKILVPSNICHSIPLAIVYSNNIPLFYDVNRETGNPCADSIIQLVNINKVAAIVIPNMFGNIYIERDTIVEFLKRNNVYIIDDCAASLGADMRYLLTSGDAAIFSFGKNKHLDLGMGGLLATNEDIDIDGVSKNIKNSYEDAQYKVKLLDSIYKPIIYGKYYYQLLPFLNKAVSFFKDSYVYKCNWDTELIHKLDSQLRLLNETKRASFEKIEYLDQKINYKYLPYSKYKFSPGSNPWRYNILINDVRIKEHIVNIFLKNNILISKWYLPIDGMFGCTPRKNSMDFGERILNINHMKTSWKDLDNIIKIFNKMGG
jgi:hypothetical protein